MGRNLLHLEHPMTFPKMPASHLPSEGDKSNKAFESPTRPENSKPVINLISKFTKVEEPDNLTQISESK